MPNKDIMVTVHLDSLVDRLGEIANSVDELTELVPDWSQKEAEDIRQQIADKLGETITANRMN